MWKCSRRNGRQCPGICMERLRKTLQTLVNVVSFMNNVHIGNTPNTSQKQNYLDYTAQSYYL
jgi:hypothetical protein